MDTVTCVVAKAFAADPAAREALRRLQARLLPLDDTLRAGTVWREGCVRLLREGAALQGVRTALVVHAAEHAPATVEGYGALLAWGADRADWRAVARLAATWQSAGG